MVSRCPIVYGAVGGTYLQPFHQRQEEPWQGLRLPWLRFLWLTLWMGMCPSLHQLVLACATRPCFEQPLVSRRFLAVRSSALQYSVTVFSYALGSGADATITKQLACDNRGAANPGASIWLRIFIWSRSVSLLVLKGIYHYWFFSHGP